MRAWPAGTLSVNADGTVPWTGGHPETGLRRADEPAGGIAVAAQTRIRQLNASRSALHSERRRKHGEAEIGAVGPAPLQPPAHEIRLRSRGSARHDCRRRCKCREFAPSKVRASSRFSCAVPLWKASVHRLPAFAEFSIQDFNEEAVVDVALEKRAGIGQFPKCLFRTEIVVHFQDEAAAMLDQADRRFGAELPCGPAGRTTM